MRHSSGIQQLTMATQMVPTVGNQSQLNNGTTSTTVKEQEQDMNINNMLINNWCSTLVCLGCVHQGHHPSTMLQHHSRTDGSSSMLNHLDIFETSGQ
eukprot:1142751-Amphidinium_carterae.1